MFEETLVEGARENLAVLARSDILQDAYLAGGTAAALQLGHRISVDLDFFTTREFTRRALSAELSRLGSFDEEQADRGTLLGAFNGIRFSLFIYEYPLIFPPVEYLSLGIADIREAWETRETVQSEFGLLSVVSRDGLILLKSLRGSGQDQDDIRRLKGEGKPG